jgi:predicted ATPase
MKIKEIRLKDFKRFTALTISGIPETAKLVILAGPNGSGKSSLFEGMSTWQRFSRGRGHWQEDYHRKGASRSGFHESVQLALHGGEPLTGEQKLKAVYVRTAYRNDAEFKVSSLHAKGRIVDEDSFQYLIENDATVSKNYERLASQGMEDLFEQKEEQTTFGEYRQESIGEIQGALNRLFPDLKLLGVGNPLRDGTFRFEKGVASGFPYKNLSAGEKAAFDLILDLSVKKPEYDDTVFCIDEPEAHMSTRLQGALLDELMKIIPDGSQLWLATHSIGMMRQARDMYRARTDEVVFVDFDGVDFDQPQTLEPVKPTRAFWNKVLEVSLADLAALVAPERVIICEGSPKAGGGKNAEHDARCFDAIFAEEFPEAKFLAGGDHSSVTADRLALMQAIEALVRGVKVTRVIDRDDRSDEEIADLVKDGVCVLSRRNLEGYLFDDEVLAALCRSVGEEEKLPDVLIAKANAIAEAGRKGAAEDDLKAASGEIYKNAKQMLKLRRPGNDAKSFMRSTLAALMRPGMAVYEELKKDVFGR